jgi:hypothetical protein
VGSERRHRNASKYFGFAGMRGLSEGVYEEVVALYESGDGFTYFDLKNDLYYQLFYGTEDPLD